MNNVNGPSRSIAVLAIILFALSGLISGFAVGGFLHSRLGQSGTSGAGTTSEGQATKPPASHTSQPTALEYPSVDSYSTIERANGTTYTLTAHAISKQNNVNLSGITCKLWLVQRIPATKILEFQNSTLEDVNSIQSLITGSVDGRQFKEVNGLNFDSSTPQTHFCNANGQITWKYQVATSVDSGEYDLVVLTDWNGVRYSWSWRDIDIK